MIHYKNVLNINLVEEKLKNLGKISTKIPRSHQDAAHNAMDQFYFKQDKTRGILVLPTGSGKTYTAVFWLLKNVIPNHKKILWLADVGILLEQAREAFRENILEVDSKRRSEINIRIVSGSDKHSNANQISISDDILLISSQTAISHWDDPQETKLKKYIEEHGKNDNLFIVYDEAHHTPAFGRRNLLIGGSKNKIGIVEKYPDTKLLGLTATPTYTDKRQKGWLWEVFKDGIIFEVGKKELEDKKILANPIFIQERTEFNLVLSDAEVEGLVFKHHEIPNHIIEEIAKNEDRNKFIAEYYIKNIEKYGKTIIFLDRWYQCKTVEKYINQIAGREIAASVFSTIDTNKNIDYINNRKSNQNDINLDRFRCGELQVLINVRILTEGVDVPDVKTVFLTRDTNSNILFTQMIGRALRGKEAGGNKDSANIVMFSDKWNRHIQFASNRFIGGKVDAVKERGYRPLELISMNILDQLQIEYHKKDYELSILDFMPIGWYVVAYTDAILEQDEYLDIQKVMESFFENIVVLKDEEIFFDHLINNFDSIHIDSIWEKEELEFEKSENILEHLVLSLGSKPNKALTSKLIKVARHIGQNRTKPEYFTFEDKDKIDLQKHVIYLREKSFGRDEIEIYLENLYGNVDNLFFKVIFPNYEDFYRAYEYEDNVFRRRRRGKPAISEANQNIVDRRLANVENRSIVFSRDGYKCLCCGKTKNLQLDHIIPYKYESPNDDNPELYQTLCSICNQNKNTKTYNFRNQVYNKNECSVVNVLTYKNEDTNCFFARLINCYYKKSAIHFDTVVTKNHGQSIWRAAVKYTFNPNDNILTEKDKIIRIIREKGFKLKDFEVYVK